MLCIRRLLCKRAKETIETKAEMLPPLEYIYNQDLLFKKINTCFRLQGKSKVSDAGHCHGLAALWLKRKIEKCAHYFYEMRATIIECPDEKLLEISKEINQFYEDIKIAHANQRHSAMVIEEKSDNALDDEFDSDNFREFLQKNIPIFSGMLIRSVTDKKHTIAVYREAENCYSLFDANFEHNKDFPTAQQDLFFDIRDRFYSSFKLPTPKAMPLEIDVITPRRRLIADYPRHFKAKVLSAAESPTAPSLGIYLSAPQR